MKNPPILIAVLGFFALLAGFGFLFFGLRVLGFDWFGALGDLPPLEHLGLWGWIAVLSGLIWILAALGLWALQPWARLFAQIVAGFALFEAALAFIQFPGTGIGLGMALMPALILWYLGTTEVKSAFGLVPVVAAAAAAPAVATAPAPAPAAAAPAPAQPAPVAVAAVAAAAAPAPEPAPAPAPVAAAVVTPVAGSAVADAPTAAAPAVGEAHPATPLRIHEVEGIGPVNAEKLAAVGIHTTADLLAAGATPRDREQLAESTGISGALVLTWVKKADLMRIPGVASQYSDLLEAAGVDSPAELAQRNPAHLAETFQEVVAARPGTVRRIPTEADVATWIEEARALPKVVEH